MATRITVGTNSYITLANAETFFLDVLHAENWDAATDATKEKALITACREMNTYSWIGYKVLQAQALEFPRTTNSPSLLNFAYEDIGTPQQIIDGQCMLALAMLNEDIQTTRLLEKGVSARSLDGASITYGNFTNPNQKLKKIYNSAYQYFKDYIDVGGCLI